MKIDTDDEVYRVDAVWLGPPKAPFPWRARYVAYGLGLLIFIGVVALERAVGIEMGLWSTVWALIATVFVTRLITDKIDHERPLRVVAQLVSCELSTPREQTSPTSGRARRRPKGVAISTTRPSPRPSRTERRRGNKTRKEEDSMTTRQFAGGEQAVLDGDGR